MCSVLNGAVVSSAVAAEVTVGALRFEKWLPASVNVLFSSPCLSSEWGFMGFIHKTVFQRDACPWKFQSGLIFASAGVCEGGSSSHRHWHQRGEAGGAQRRPRSDVCGLCLLLLGEIKEEWSHLQGWFTLKTQGREYHFCKNASF